MTEPGMVDLHSSGPGWLGHLVEEKEERERETVDKTSLLYCAIVVGLVDVDLMRLDSRSEICSEVGNQTQQSLLFGYLIRREGKRRIGLQSRL